MYQPLKQKDADTGKMYKECDMPDGFELPPGYVITPIPSYLKFPEWNPQLGRWGEDKDQIIDALTATVNALNDAKNQLVQDTMDLMELIGGVE